MKKIVLLLLSVVAMAQLSYAGYNPVTLTAASFNADAIANGSLIPTSCTSFPGGITTFDNAGYDLVASGYSYGGGLSPNYSLPASGLVTSTNSTYPTTFQFASYAGNNALYLRYLTNTTGTLTFVTPTAAQNVFVAGVSGTAATTVAFTLNFTDGTTQTGTTATFQDWYTAPITAMTCLTAIGRTGTTGGEGGSNSGPNLSQVTIPVSTANQTKLIASVSVSLTSTTNGCLGLFAVSTQNAVITTAGTPTTYSAASCTTSPEQVFTVSGTLMSPATGGTVTATAPAGFLISTTTGTGYAASVALPFTSATLTATPIYVQFAPTATGTYNANVTFTGGTVFNPGTVIALTGVANGYSVTPTSTASFGLVNEFTTSAAQIYTLTATSLTAGTTTIATSNPDFLISTDGVTYSSTSLTFANGTSIAGAPIYIEFNPNAIGVETANITISGGGVCNALVTTTGVGASLCTGTPTPTAITSSSVTGCGSYSSNLAIPGAATTVLGLTYQWMQSSDNVTFTNVPGATTTAYTASVTASVYYTYSLGCTYSSLGSNAPSALLHLDYFPTPITGTLSACTATTSTLTATPLGGTWTSSNAAIVSIDPASGIATGVGGGTVTVTYSVTCGSVTTPFTEFTPTSISGSPSVCATASLNIGESWESGGPTLSGTPVDGWVTNATVAGYLTYTTSGTTPPATAESGSNFLDFHARTYAGVTATVSSPAFSMTGVTGATVTYWVYRDLTAYTAPSFTTEGFTVYMGTTVGSTTTSMGFVPRAGTVSTTGAVAGTATVTASGWYQYTATIPATYTGATNFVTFKCVSQNGDDIYLDNIAITGTIPTSTTLTDGTPGGTWSTSNAAIATINSTSGVLASMGVGTTSVTYTTSCSSISQTITTMAGPAAITASVSNICAGTTATFTDPTLNGTWSSSNAAIASFASSSIGTITGVSGGTVAVSYSNGCGIAARTVFSVTAQPAAIAGTSTICGGSSSTFSVTPTGGVWSSTNTAIANITSTGIVTGISGGGVNISYTIGGCYSTYSVTVNGPGSITGTGGTLNVCGTGTNTLNSATAGGTWASSNSAIATIDPSSGILQGMGGSTTPDTITYNYLGCLARAIIFDGTTPTPIAGTFSVCVGASSLLTDVSGGTWSSSATATASISTTGNVTGITGGTTTISYATPGCAAVTATVTINAVPAAIGNNVPVLAGNTNTLTDATTGGTWSSGATAVATISTSGTLSGIAGGVAPITYTSALGCVAIAQATVTPTSSLFYTPLALSGFNTDIIANGSGPSASPTGSTNSSAVTGNLGFDAGGFAFLGADYSYGASVTSTNCYNSTTQLYALPASGRFNSYTNSSLPYQLANYSGNNALLINAGTLSSSYTGTLTLTTPIAADTLYVLGVSATPTSSASVTVTFTDGTTQMIPLKYLLHNWFDCSTTAGIPGARVPEIADIGRLTASSGLVQTGSATGPDMYKDSLVISAANQGKLVQSLVFSVAHYTGGTYSILGLFAVTARSGILQTSSSTLTFASTSMGCSSAASSVTISGAGLVPVSTGSVTATAPAGFQVSTDGSTWASTAVYPVSATGTVASTLYVRFSPTTPATTSGSITFSGGGGISTLPSIAVSGTVFGFYYAPTTVAAFGPVSDGATSPAITYTFNGVGLTSGTVTATSSNPNFLLSSTGTGGSWATTANFVTTSTLSATLYVEYVPVSIGAESSTISFSGAGTSCLTSITATGTGSNSCIAPTAPSAVTLSGTTSSATTVNFTPVGSADGYLLVQGTAPFSGAPVTATTYHAGDALGGGTVVGSYSASVTVPVSGLVGNTLYYYTVIPFNGGATGTCSGGPVYPVSAQTTNTVITCVATPAFTTNTYTINSITLNWGSVGGGNASAVTYTVVVSPTSTFSTSVTGSPFIITDPTTSLTVGGLTTGTTYYYKITATSATSACTSTPATGSLATGSYCTPAISSSSFYTCSGYYTNSVVFNGSTWTGSAGTCATSNYVSTVFTVTAGVAAPITITSSSYTGSAAWVDFSNTGSFNDVRDGIFLPAYSGAGTVPYSGTVTVPATVPTGSYRMRVLSVYGTAWTTWVPGATQGPCGTYVVGGDGNYQDFTLYVVNPTITSTATLLTAFGPTATCSSTAAQTFSITGTGLVPAVGNIVANAPAGGYQVSTDGTAWGSTATYAYTGAALPASTVYVRFSPTVAGTPSGNITFTGALTTPSVAVTASATGMTLAPATTAVFGPIDLGTSSAAHTYTLTGTGLTTGTVTVTSSNAHFQVSPDGTTWAASYNFVNTSTIPTADASVYVRYSPTVAATESSVVTISGTSPGCVLTFTATGTGTSTCAAPSAPAVITATGTSASSASIGFTASGTPDGYLVLNGTTAFSGTPVSATTYTVGSVIGTGTVVAVYNTATPPLAITTSTVVPINSNTGYYVTVIPFNGGLYGTCGDGPLYATTYPTATYTTCPAAPASVTTSSVTGASFAANWVAVPGGGADAMTYKVDVTTDPTFATGVTTYTASASPYTVAGLSGTTNYYFRVSAVSAACTSVYSSSVAVTTTCGITPLPYLETFESITAANTLPQCMAATNLGVFEHTFTYTGPTGSFNQASYTGGTKFASFEYGCNDFFFTPQFSFIAGNTYQVSFEYVTDGYGGWTTLEAKYGNAQTAAAMTTVVGTPVSGATNTTYQAYTGVFTATATGTYYVGIYCLSNTIPYYLTIDNIAVQQLPSIVAAPVSMGTVATCAAAVQSFTMSANSLLPAASGTITATAPTGYQVSADGVTYGTTANYTYTSGALPTSTVYVKYTPTVVGTFGSSIVFTGGSVTPAYTVAVTGTATGMVLSPTTVAAFGPINVGTTSAPLTYAVTGAGLTTGTVTVTSSNPRFQVSPTGLAGTWATTYNFTNASTLSAQVYVQYSPTVVGAATSTISISGTSPGCALTFTATGTGANPCATPASAATAMTFPTITSTSVTASFTPATITDGFLMVVGTAAYTGTVTAGTTYATGASVGSATVLGYYSYTATPSYAIPGLTSNTKYYVTAIPFNGGMTGSCGGGPLYGPALTNTVITCVNPTTPITTTSISNNGFTLNWPSSVGGGATATNYTINVANDAAFTAPIAGFPVTVADGGGAQTYAVTGAPSGTTLYYSIVALGACNSAVTTGTVTTIANFEPIALSGFNVDIIANGAGTTAASSVNTTAIPGVSGFDGVNWVFVAANYSYAGNVPLSGTFGSGTTIQPYSLPLSGLLTSLITPGLRYHLANYSGNNALMISNTSTVLTGTLTCTTPQYASQLYVVGCTGSGGSVTPNVTFNVNFTDGTVQSATTATAFSDWYYGSNIAEGSVGRVNVSTNNTDGTSSGPNFYQYNIPILPANYGRQIKNVGVNVASGAAGYLGLFAISEEDGLLSSTTDEIDFAGTALCTTTPVQTFSVSGGSLAPAAGTLTVTATTGFKIATSASGPFTATVSLPYTGSALANTALYVEYTPSVTGTVTGAVSFTGGTVNSSGTVIVTGSGVSGTISGVAAICPATTSTLTETLTGGTWSSSSPTVATVSTAGVVSGITAGSATISYSKVTACGTEVDSTILTVNPLPNAGTITGTVTVCATSVTALSDVVTGGTWSSTSPTVATVDASGNVTGITAGTSLISYSYTNSCGTAVATVTATVNPLANAGSITGTATVCAGLTSTLADASTGGIWSSSTSSVATVDASGNVTGIAAGTTTISYSVTNSCNTAVAVTVFTVNPQPVAGTITGTLSVCSGLVSALSDAATGGTWSSTTEATATVDASGNVTGIAAGTTTISYTVTNGCGTAATASVFTVNPSPDGGVIAGATIVCVGLTNTLTDAIAGGTWSSTASSVATVDASGNVTGIAEGTSTISYVVTNGCGTAFATTIYTVSPQPVAGTITGGTELCAGTTLALTDVATGGSWSSTNPASATVDASGTVTALAAGTTTISYSVTNGCATLAATQDLTINPAPNAGGITGATTVCAGLTAALADTATGGTWSSTASSVATVDASGNVTGIAEGTTTISYTASNGCGTVTATAVFTVNPQPVTGTITGGSTVCAGTTLSLTDAATDGTWSSTNPASATVDASGNVTAIAEGTTTISYAVTNGCGTLAATQDVTINGIPNAGAITGTVVACAGSTTALADTATGGTWTSTDPAFATVDASGVVTGIAGGTTTISYTVINGCGTVTATASYTVNPLPITGTITGTLSACIGTTSTLTDVATDGIWSSTTEATATVDASGVVTAIAAGTTTISYTVSNGCGTLAAVKVFTVNPIPNAGTITGAATVCQSATTSFSTTVTGGVWSSTGAFATVDASGLVSGVTSGIDTIIYTVTNSCGTAADSLTITVTPSPVAGTITGTTTLCAGTTTTLTDATTGGTWSSTSPSVATVDGSGLVTAIAGGTTTISYTATNGCGSIAATSVITVDTIPGTGTITGSATVCLGSTTALTDAVTGGTWSSTSTGTATVNTSGVVTGIAVGTTTISYAFTNVCGTYAATTTVTVNPLPSAGTITGTVTVCAGTTTTLADAVTGGTWTSLSSVATVNTAGVVTGITAGADTIVYTVLTVCGAAADSIVVTVNPLPNAGAIAGTYTVCAGSATTLTNVATGGTWSTTGTDIATVDTTGILTGVTAGTDTVVYTVTNGCGTAADSVVITINAIPTAFTITGGGSYCTGGAGVNVGLSGSETGVSYQLYVGGTTAGAAVTGTGSALDFGAISFAGTYTVVATNATGCSTDMTGSVTVTVNPIVTPIVTITATPGTNVPAGTTVTLTAGVTGGGAAPTYQWQLNGTNITGATSATYVSVYANDDSVTCIVTNTDACGSSANSSVTITFNNIGVKPVLNIDANVSVIPNPNKGVFTIKGTWPIVNGEVALEVVDMLGQVVYKDNVNVQNGKIDASIKLANTLANGMYILNMHNDDTFKVFHFVLQQ